MLWQVTFLIRRDIPSGTIWMWVPNNGNPPDYKLEGVTVRFSIRGDSIAEMRLDFSLLIFTLRRYDFAILQPMTVSETAGGAATASTPLGTVIGPTTNLTSRGEYLTKISYTPAATSSVKITFSMFVINPVSIDEWGKRMTKLTFWGGVLPNEINEFTKQMTFEPIFRGHIVFSIEYPPDWLLSPSETYPPSDKPFTMDGYRAASWDLNFSRILPDHGETLTLVWSIPAELGWRDTRNFLAGLLTATGAGVASDALRDFLVDRKKRSKSRCQLGISDCWHAST
jgi:hypothetical protein